MAATGSNSFLRVADTLPGLRRDLLQPGYLWQVLSNEAYPSRSLPELAAPGARLELYRRVRAHAALDAYLPAQSAPIAVVQGAFPEPGKIASPLPTQESVIYLIGDGYAVQKQTKRDTKGKKEARREVLSFARNAPTWRPLDFPADWDLWHTSSNGRWAYAHQRTNNQTVSFRLFDLSRNEPLACYSGSYCGDFPIFAADGQALLFTDEFVNRLRLNRVDLSQASMPIVRLATSASSNYEAILVRFSPHGHRAAVFAESARIYSFTKSTPSTESHVDDLDEEYARLVWSSDEAHLRFFYPHAQRAVTFSLDQPLARGRAFAPETDVLLRVQACQGEHLLTVRPQGGDEIWQLYGWNGKAASAQVTLPQGRRNHEDHSALVGSRAILPQDRDPATSAGFTFFADFAEANPIPLALGNTRAFELSGSTRTDSDWLVGESRYGHPASYRLVNTGLEGGKRGQAVQLPSHRNGGLHVRANGRAALVGRPGLGLLAYRLAP